jgi:hypothetical protein
VAILNKSVRSLLLKLSLDEEISYFEDPADKTFDLLGVRRTLDWDYYMAESIRNNGGNNEYTDVAHKVNVGNILRNSQFTFDSSSGRIKFEWIYPQDNIHVAFVISQQYEVNTQPGQP